MGSFRRDQSLFGPLSYFDKSTRGKLLNLSLGLSATVDKSTVDKSTRGKLQEINLSLGLSATVDKSTRGKLLRDQSLFGPLSYC